MLRRRATAVGTASLLPLLLGAGPPPDPGPCRVIDNAGLCLVAAADPGRAGGPFASAPHAPRRRSPAPTASSGDRTTTDVPTTLLFGFGPNSAFAQQVPNSLIAPPTGPGAAPQAPPVDPAVLARRAIEQLNLTRPSIRVSAASHGYVGVPIWLWIDGGVANIGPVSATAAVGAASVTATARLVSTQWSMGPPGATVRCNGPGTPWRGQPGASPDCGYVYSQRSLPDRTNGTGVWPVTVTAVWQVTWTGFSGGAPVVGVQGLELTATRALPVGELQVLVTGGGT
jgi:hypothetical protein